MDKRFWGILVAVVIILGGVFLITNHGNGSGGGNGKPTNHIEGLGKDKVALVEYGDYQCPYCGEYYSTVKQVQQAYNDEITFQFRNLPLTELHPNAYAGARAAEAAALQNKFWQMHDKLYSENQLYYAAQDDGQTYNTWINSSNPENDFVQYAQQLGLNVTQFKQDYSSDKVNNSIEADTNQFPIDFKAATGSYNANTDEATPTFFLDGKHISPAPTVSSFEQLLNAAIKSKGFTPPATSTPSSSSSSTSTPAAGQSKQ